MKLFSRSYEKFAALATDTERRRAAIATHASAQAMIFLVALVFLVFAFIEYFLYENAALTMGYVGLALFAFMIAFHFESNLHLLMMIDRLQDQSCHNVATKPVQPTPIREDAGSRGRIFHG